MRVCADCGVEDRAHLDNLVSCDCKAERYEPEAHNVGCNALIHSVALYVVRIAKADLTPDALLPNFFQERGWKLKRDGNRFYRGKFLCRECIDREELTNARAAEYKKLCRAARGIVDQTYVQMLAQALN